MKEHIQLAQQFLKFVDSSPTPFHAVQQAKLILTSHGFKDITSFDNITEDHHKYFFSKGGSALLSFILPQKYNKTERYVKALRIIGSHSDSPCLKLAPHHLIRDAYDQFNVVTYGGGLWSTWMDRDLGVAGKIFYSDKEKGTINSGLYDSHGPICKVPHLAIHLRQQRDRDTIKKDSSLRPIFLCNNGQKPSTQSKQLLADIGQQLSIPPQSIIETDLFLYDPQPAALIGLKKQFISSPRIDNLMSVFISTMAIANSSCSDLLKVSAVFDNQEVGSLSLVGADSSFLMDFIDQAVKNKHQALKRSFLLSADMAHAMHPNYSVHEPRHLVLMNKGFVIKFNQNMRYCGTSQSHAILKHLAATKGIKFQNYSVRNQSPCGSTIGPFISSQTGCLGADVGIGQLSMHSCRELCGAQDPLSYLQLMQSVLELQSVQVSEHSS